MKYMRNNTAVSNGIVWGRMLLCLLLPLLSSGCGPSELMKLRFGRVESFRTESVGFGAVKGRAVVSSYNGNKKNVTFESGRIEVLLDGRTIGIATLAEPVAVAPGAGVVEVPLRIRFPQSGLKVLSERFRRGETGGRRGKKKRDVRIAGSLDIDCGGRRKTVRFKRRVGEKTWQRVGDALFGTIEFRL